jgi:hypothetical protein
MEKTRAFFQSARRYEVDPNAGADAARNKSPVVLQEELVRGGAMRRRARRQWRKDAALFVTTIARARVIQAATHWANMSGFRWICSDFSSEIGLARADIRCK